MVNCKQEDEAVQVNWIDMPDINFPPDNECHLLIGVYLGKAKIEISNTSFFNLIVSIGIRNIDTIQPYTLCYN